MKYTVVKTKRCIWELNVYIKVYMKTSKIKVYIKELVEILVSVVKYPELDHI